MISKLHLVVAGVIFYKMFVRLAWVSNTFHAHWKQEYLDRLNAKKNDISPKKTISQFVPRTYIICRNNNPLFHVWLTHHGSLALSLITL